jgi:ectoine hydroxylase-related dioxygenase (phytanoyl-CoA dioxygenase family)
MNLHSDQALVAPPPWMTPWAMNIIWCLDDVDEGNGATRYLPGSHRFQTLEAVPADALAATRPFEAPAGAFIAMDGRLWHTSGRNLSRDRRRRMMFAYYSCDFIRQQANWMASLPAEVQAAMDEETHALFGLLPYGNHRLASPLTRLAPA